MKAFDAAYVDNELREIGARIKKPVAVFLIGGCAMSFRGLKESTKDVDIVFKNKLDYAAFCGALFGAQYFEPARITDEYAKLKAARMFENKDGFHLDLFVNRVCGKLKLSSEMVERSEFFKKYGELTVNLVSKEDVFLFKSIASEGRKRDLDDMKTIYPNLNWKIVDFEIKRQRLSLDFRRLIENRLKEFKEKFELDVPALESLKTVQ